MPLHRVTWRAWAVVLGGVAAYGLLGFWLSSNGMVEEWLYRIGLLAASVVPVLFVALYTAFGLHSSQVAAKWWRTSLGTALVIAAASLIPITWPLAWVFWFQGGSLRQSWLAWIEVSGPCLSALAWLRVCQLWLRFHAAGSRAD